MVFRETVQLPSMYGSGLAMNDFKDYSRSYNQAQMSCISTGYSNAAATGSTLCNILEPHQNDVLMGRGGKNNQHSGNELLRQFAREYSTQYRAASKKEKPTIAWSLVQRIKAQTPPGRFLKLVTGSNEWEEVTEDVAREKASQCLRDTVAALLRVDEVKEDVVREKLQQGPQRQSLETARNLTAASGYQQTPPNALSLQPVAPQGNLGQLQGQMFSGLVNRAPSHSTSVNTSEYADPAGIDQKRRALSAPDLGDSSDIFASLAAYKRRRADYPVSGGTPVEISLQGIQGNSKPKSTSDLDAFQVNWGAQQGRNAAFNMEDAMTKSSRSATMFETQMRQLAEVAQSQQQDFLQQQQYTAPQDASAAGLSPLESFLKSYQTGNTMPSGVLQHDASMWNTNSRRQSLFGGRSRRFSNFGGDLFAADPVDNLTWDNTFGEQERRMAQEDTHISTASRIQEAVEDDTILQRLIDRMLEENYVGV